MSSVAVASPGDFGLAVLVQPWNPITDDDEPLRVLDEPALISNTYHQIWNAGYGPAHDLFVGWLGTGDLITEGITLYDIDLRIAQPQLSVRRLPGGEADSLLGVSFVFDDIHFEATSTTPDIPGLGFGVGEYADPAAASTSISPSIYRSPSVGMLPSPCSPTSRPTMQQRARSLASLTFTSTRRTCRATCSWV